MAIKAVVFDLDNTLYDYEACNTLAEKELLRLLLMNLVLLKKMQRCFLKMRKLI